MKFDVNTKEAQKLIAVLVKTEVGNKVAFDGTSSPIQAFPVGAEAICVEADPVTQFWQFALYWLSMRLGDVVLEINGNDLIAEVL